MIVSPLLPAEQIFSATIRPSDVSTLVTALGSLVGPCGPAGFYARIELQLSKLTLTGRDRRPCEHLCLARIQPPLLLLPKERARKISCLNRPQRAGHQRPV